MVEYYPTNQSAYTQHGIILHPSKCEVTWQDAGRYDLDMEMPLAREGYLHTENELIGYGSIIRASVPPQHIPEITIETSTAYWRVKSGQTADLLKNLPYTQYLRYQEWQPARAYTGGDKVTYSGVNYQCTTGHGGISTPPPQNPTLWTQISSTTTIPATVLTTLSAGTQFTKLGDYSNTYMRAKYGNYEGFIDKSKCEFVSNASSRTWPAKDITAQAFRVTEISKDTKSNVMRVHAVHVSYLLNGMLLDECKLVEATPQNALAAIYGAMMDEWDGDFLTSITTGTISEDYTNRMAGDVILNPSSGFIENFNGRLIRDDRDIVIVPNTYSNGTTYELAYGSNILGVTWTVNIDEMVTRVYPVAKNSDDTVLYLPTKYIESIYSHDWDVMEVLDTGLKVGDTEEKSDGTEITLTLTEVRKRMAEQAQARFDHDHCDLPKITLDVNFLDLGDTEEYAQYKGLATLAPYEYVNITHGPLGLTLSTQLIGYTWDSIRDVYTKTTFGDVQYKAGRTVTDYDLKSGSVTRRALSTSLKRTLGI